MVHSSGQEAGFSLPGGRAAVFTVAALIVALICAGMAGAYGRGKMPRYGCSGYTGFGYAGQDACADATKRTNLPPAAAMDGPSRPRVGSNEFSASGYDTRKPENAVTKVEWDFGNDGTIDAVGETVDRTFASPGLVDVKVV